MRLLARPMAINFIVTALVCLLPMESHSASGNPFVSVAPFKSAIIHYDVDGTEKGKETLYIADRGKRTVKVTKSSGKFMMISRETDLTVITTPKEIVTIDGVKDNATKITNPQVYFTEEYNKLNSTEKANVRENVKKFGANFAGQMGGKLEQKATTIMGYECDKASVMGISTYNIHKTNIMLKTTEGMIGMKMNIVAT